MIGFNLDTSEIETELANCRAVYEKYYSELFTGAREPREMVETINEELEKAGWETIREKLRSRSTLRSNILLVVFSICTRCHTVLSAKQINKVIHIFESDGCADFPYTVITTR